MVKLIKAKFDGTPIQFNDSGWFNATVAAKKFGKRPVDWLKQKDTQEYIQSLADIIQSDPESLSKTQRGGAKAGTWLHPKLSVAFARWCDIKFGVWCDQQIEEIIYGKPEDTDWKKLRHSASSSFKVMNDVLKGTREDVGKDTKGFHYANEAKLVNWAMTGEFKPLDRELLSSNELDTLAKLESRNAVMIARGADRELRKEVLSGMAKSLLTIKIEGNK